MQPAVDVGGTASVRAISVCSGRSCGSTTASEPTWPFTFVNELSHGGIVKISLQRAEARDCIEDRLRDGL
jgi:hypothetical protein